MTRRRIAIGGLVPDPDPPPPVVRAKPAFVVPGQGVPGVPGSNTAKVFAAMTAHAQQAAAAEQANVAAMNAAFANMPVALSAVGVEAAAAAEALAAMGTVVPYLASGQNLAEHIDHDEPASSITIAKIKQVLGLAKARKNEHG